MGAFDGKTGGQLQRALMVAAWLLVLLFAVGIVYLLASLRSMGEGVPATNTITVSGTGDIYAVPDTGEFSFSVVSDKPTVAAAQADAAAKINALTSYLAGAGVDSKDMQTTDYSISPQYEYQNAMCPQASPTNGSMMSPIYCPPQRQVLKGYEVRQTTSVKVRNLAAAGDLLAGVGQKGATEVSGLSFTVNDPAAVKAQARDKAIADAKAKADELAKALGVSLVRVVSFSENQGNIPMPMYSMAAASSAGVSTAPDISAGQNKVTDNVSIIYEIR